MCEAAIEKHARGGLSMASMRQTFEEKASLSGASSLKQWNPDKEVVLLTIANFPLYFFVKCASRKRRSPRSRSPRWVPDIATTLLTCAGLRE